jgi:hypothetical protein
MFNSIYEKFIVNLNLEKCLHKVFVIYLKILSKKNKLFLKYNIKTSFSSFNQDTWIIKNIFKYKKNLFFIDVGAYDGISNSNTILFEKFYNWKGLLFEPNKINYNKLLKFRNNSFCHQIVISNFNQKLINITNNDQLSRIEKRGVYKVKPGITGLAQVSGINMSRPVLLAKADLKMIKQMNIFYYFFYIFKTVLLIFRKEL